VQTTLEVLACEEPRGAGDELEVLEKVVPRVGTVDELAHEAKLLVAARRLLPPLEREALLARLALDLLEQLVDRLVAQGGDADALARSHQRDRHLRSLPGLPRAGRPLQEEVAVLDRGDGLDRRQVEAGTRELLLQDGTHRSRRTTVQARLRQPRERPALLAIVDRRLRDQRSG